MNGAGKSTLVKALADGSTVLAGTRILARDTRIGYFAQHQLDLLDPEQSPLDHLRQREPDTREAELRRYLGSFGFSGDRIFDPVAPFSGGEKARLVLALMIRQQPNLLLLDEPTNHLDLEMRQALSRALVDFEGAIVLISHDRHLLRTVCDDLIVVRGGRIQRFDGSLDDYAAWLAEQRPATVATQSAGPGDVPGRAMTPDPSVPTNRKAQRRLEARRRQALKPLTDKVREIERRLAENRSALCSLERQLADPTLYSEADRKAEIKDLLRDRARLSGQIDSLETRWLEASEALERAVNDDAGDGGTGVSI
jgi:ATP-binding cassette subfamily F protein 3